MDEGTSMCSTQTWLHSLLWLGLSFVLLGVAVTSFLGWRSTTTGGPQDEELVELSGVVTRVKTHGDWEDGSLTGITFWLEGSNIPLYYGGHHTRLTEIRRRLEEGAAIRAHVVNQGRPHIWRLVINGETIASREQIRRAYIRNGQAGLAIAITMAIISAFAIFAAITRRPFFTKVEHSA